MKQNNYNLIVVCLLSLFAIQLYDVYCTEVDSGDDKCSCNPGYYNNGGTCNIRKYFNIFIKITKSMFLVFSSPDPNGQRSCEV
jgi:hypothetical protein